MSSLGGKVFTAELVTASDSLSNCRELNSNYGSFFYILKDSGGANLPGPDYSTCTDSRITYTFKNAFNIREIRISAESSVPASGYLYVILAPADSNREFISHIALSDIAREEKAFVMEPQIFMENVTDKLKLRFVFKDHPVGSQLKYYITFDGEEFTNQ